MIVRSKFWFFSTRNVMIESFVTSSEFNSIFQRHQLFTFKVQAKKNNKKIDDLPFTLGRKNTFYLLPVTETCWGWWDYRVWRDKHWIFLNLCIR